MTTGIPMSEWGETPCPHPELRDVEASQFGNWNVVAEGVGANYYQVCHWGYVHREEARRMYYQVIDMPKYDHGGWVISVMDDFELARRINKLKAERKRE